MKKFSQRKKFPHSRGFTLVELLVVVAIISILLTLGSMTISGMGGSGVSSAVAQTEAVFNEARSVAMSKSTNSRVMIFADEPDDEAYLRRVVVGFNPIDEDGEPEEDVWELTGNGLQLPEGVYFSQDFSRTDHEGGSGDIEEMDLTGVSGLYNGTYFYYQFNAEGICTTGLADNGTYTAPSFVVGSGRRDPGGEPQTTGKGRRDFGGFVIWRNGSSSVFRDPEQIIGDTDPTEF